MGKEKPRRGKAPGRGLGKFATGSADINRSPAQNQPIDYDTLRARLCGARRRLLERLADDWAEDRRFPDSGWTRLLADIQAVIMAVDAVVAEGGP